MNLFDAIALGSLQGATEFLPVSSSGHLRLAEVWLNAAPPSLLFDISLHVGTLIAIGIVFRRDLRVLVGDWVGRSEIPWLHRPGVRQALLIAAAMVPTAVLGVLLEPLVQGPVEPGLVGGLLLVNGLILLSSWRTSRRDGPTSTGYDPAGWGISLTAAVLIGMAQGVGVLPGISRSGITITAALLLGIGRGPAATFSFLLSIPAILGALFLEVGDLGGYSSADLLAASVGAVVAGMVGVICLRVLLVILRQTRFHHFAWYCMVIGFLAVGWNFLA